MHRISRAAAAPPAAHAAPAASVADPATALAPQRGRTAFLAAFFVFTLITVLGSNPFAASASALQLHGALSRSESFGVISHRGAAALAPENTLAAMRRAFEQGVDFVEADLHLTADGVPVLMHDPTVDRTTDGLGAVSGHSLEQIRALDAGSWFGAEFAGEPVPTLAEFLDELTPTNSRALIELKGSWTDEQVAAAVDMLAERYLMDRVAFESFELENLERLALLAPEYARVMLTRDWDRATLATAAALKVSAIGARNKVFARDFALVAEARVLGIGTMVYTLNTEKQWAKARSYGIDLVITDDPVALEAWRGDPSSDV